ncbi:MAG: hypothetical protein Q7T08_11115 [Devosia sp.]|nr:hypothetical protein [Devosia sp.]
MAIHPKLEGWNLHPDGTIQFFNYAGGGVLPTQHVIAVAMRYVTSQEQLDRVKVGQAKPEQIQFALNSQHARHLAEQLLKAADLMERDKPPRDRQN